MKYIIDIEELKKQLEITPSVPPQDYILQGMRHMFAGSGCPVWAKLHKEKKKPKIPACPMVYTDRFEMFWKEWPKTRRTAKRTAFKSWWKAMHTYLPEDHLLLSCLGTLQWQTQEEQWTKDDGKFIPMPATWLNNERWNDEDPNDGREWEDYLAEDGSVKQRRVE